MPAQPDTPFYEEQRFTQRWLWISLIVTLLVFIGVFGYGMIEQLVYGRPWGDRPVSNTTLVLVSLAILLFSISMIWLFYSLRLITEVSSDGLLVRYHPLHRKLIPYETISQCEARTYKPLREYGGWGIKYGPSGWAYNIVGNQGVQLVLDSGKRILVGSQRAEDLATAIAARMSRARPKP